MFTPLCSSQDINFKNEQFEKAILHHQPKIDLNNDGIIQRDEADEVEELILPDLEIDNFSDLKFFKKNTRVINISGNNASHLKLKNFRFLEELYCAGNGFRTIKLINLPKLNKLYAGVNQLTQIKLNSHNTPNLKVLNLIENQFHSIDVSKLIKLEHLRLNGNDLSSLSLEKNLNLISLSVTNNNIDNIVLSHLRKLRLDKCYFDDTTSLVLSSQQQEDMKNRKGSPPSGM